MEIAPRSDYTPLFWRLALIDVACVYLFTMPLNLRMQCYNGRKGYGRLGRAEAESRRGPVAGFDLCYAMQSNRETARIKAARWEQPAGGVEVVVLHRGGGSEGRRDESHAFLARAVAVRRAIRITNTRAEKERVRGG